ncbi:MAG: hypothetical protein ACXVCY_18810 [Pseudobdellovibrionaceae bacterium]
MKSKLVLFVTILSAFCSVQARPITEQEVLDMNAETKVQAVMGAALQAEKANEENDILEGKLMATEIMEIDRIKNEADETIARMAIANVKFGGMGQVTDQAQLISEKAHASEDSEEIYQLWQQAKEIEVTLTKVKSRLK